MRTKVTLVLLFLNAALFFFIFQYERSWRTERVAMEVRRRVLGAEAADIRALEVAGGMPGGGYRLERRGETWFLVRPFEWPANPHAVSRIVGDLQFLEHETSFSVRDVVKNGQTLGDYGLDPPKLTVTFTSGGPDTTGGPAVTTSLKIGAATKAGQRLYVLSPDGTRIHVVGRELADSLSMPLEALRADTVLTIPVFEARLLNVQAAPPAGVHVLLRRDAGRWAFESPIPARAAKDAIELAINGLDALRVRSFATGNPPVPEPKDAPSLAVTVEGDNRHETLFLGRETGAVPASAAGLHEYFAQLERMPVVFTVAVPDRLIETLRDAQEELRDRHVLDFDPSEVTVITLRAPNQPDLTLQRLEPAGGAGGAGARAGSEADWQIVVRATATSGPSTLPADREAINRLLDELSRLSAEQFKSDAPQASDLENWGFNRPEREIALTLNAPAQRVLQIGRPTQRDPYLYARLANGLSIYAIKPDILRETPVVPRFWRDRLIWSLPEAARIVALRIEEPATGKVWVDWKASGAAADALRVPAAADAQRAPAAGPRDAAIKVVLGRLRALRARSFEANSFSEASESIGRGWKYRIEATVALPGGAGGEQTGVRALWVAERTGGDEQFAGSADIGAVFAVEQPLLDALWTLTRGEGSAAAP